MQKHIITTLVVDEQPRFSRVEICQHCNISDALLQEMEEQGLFEGFDLDVSSREQAWSDQAVTRVEKALRLHQDLGINLEGVILAIQLLEELDSLRHKIAILER